MSSAGHAGGLDACSATLASSATNATQERPRSVPTGSPQFQWRPDWPPCFPPARDGEPGAQASGAVELGTSGAGLDGIGVQAAPASPPDQDSVAIEASAEVVAAAGEKRAPAGEPEAGGRRHGSTAAVAQPMQSSKLFGRHAWMPLTPSRRVHRGLSMQAPATESEATRPMIAALVPAALPSGGQDSVRDWLARVGSVAQNIEKIKLPTLPGPSWFQRDKAYPCMTITEEEMRRLEDDAKSLGHDELRQWQYELESAALRTVVQKKPDKREPRELLMLLSFLKKCKLLKDLPPELLIQTAEVLLWRRLQPKQQVVSAGEAVTDLYLIICGTVVQMAAAHTIACGVANSLDAQYERHAGYMLGARELKERGGLDDPEAWHAAKFTWSAVAERDVEVFQLPVESLRGFLRHRQYLERLVVLQDLPMTAGLNVQQASKVVRSGRKVSLHRLFELKEFPRLHIFWQQGEKKPPESSKIVFIVKGEVMLKAMGLRAETATVGDVLGEDALTGNLYQKTAIVKSHHVKVLMISVEDFLMQFGMPSSALGVSREVKFARNQGAELRRMHSQRARNARLKRKRSSRKPAEEPSEVGVAEPAVLLNNLAQPAKSITKAIRTPMKQQADRKDLVEKEWQLLQPKRLPQRVAPPGSAAPRYEEPTGRHLRSAVERPVAAATAESWTGQLLLPYGADAERQKLLEGMQARRAMSGHLLPGIAPPLTALDQRPPALQAPLLPRCPPSSVQLPRQGRRPPVEAGAPRSPGRGNAGSSSSSGGAVATGLQFFVGGAGAGSRDAQAPDVAGAAAAATAAELAELEARPQASGSPVGTAAPEVKDPDGTSRAPFSPRPLRWLPRSARAQALRRARSAELGLGMADGQPLPPQCLCGNAFTVDANYCRMCGRGRPQELQMPRGRPAPQERPLVALTDLEVSKELQRARTLAAPPKTPRNGALRPRPLGISNSGSSGATAMPSEPLSATCGADDGSSPSSRPPMPQRVHLTSLLDKLANKVPSD